MIQDYLAGEISICLGRLQRAATRDPGGQVARLRREVEDGPLAGLTTVVTHALAMADSLCWESLSRGDVVAFTCQARAAADLRQLSVCAHLIPDA